MSITLYWGEEGGDEVRHHHVGQHLLAPLWDDDPLTGGGGGGGDEPPLGGPGRLVPTGNHYIVFVDLLRWVHSVHSKSKVNQFKVDTRFLHYDSFEIHNANPLM